MNTHEPLEPEFAARLEHVYRLSRPPQSLEDYWELLKERSANSAEMKEYGKKLEAGEVVIGEDPNAEHYAVVLPDRGEVRVKCGYDTLMTALVRKDALSVGWCPHCNAKTEITIEGGEVARVSPPEAVFWLGAGPIGAPGNPVCDHLHFFPNETHLQAWLEDHPDELGVAMTIHEAADFYGRAGEQS